MFTKLKSKFSEIVVVLASVATFFIGVALIDRIFTSDGLSIIVHKNYALD